MSMFSDIEWKAKGKDEECENIFKTIKQYARRFFRGHWSFLGSGSERSGTDFTITNQMYIATELQRKRCRISQEPVIRYSVVPALW